MEEAMTPEKIKELCIMWCMMHSIQIEEARHPNGQDCYVNMLVARSSFNHVVHFLKSREKESLESICKRMAMDLGIVDPLTAIRLMTETQKAPARNFPDEGDSSKE